MRLSVVTLLASQVLCFGGDDPGTKEKRIWGASYSRELAPTGQDRRFYLFDVSQGPEHLLGAFALRRETERAESDLVIQGHINKSGDFAPNVILEVSDQEDGNWKTVESSFSDRVDVTLTGARHVDKLYVRFPLDAFQPHIGKFKLCRVTLQSGEADVFPMAWLDPQKQ